MQTGSGAALAAQAGMAGWKARLLIVVAWLAGIADSRRALWATALAAACLPWLAPRPPMIDLAQHAAQVALWRDLLLGVSPWAELLRINLLTPYLAGYALALPFSFLMSPAAAMALVLSAAALAFVAAGSALRRDYGADPRLDWLMITPFFGFAWIWGFVTFLVVAPLVLVLVRVARRHAVDPGLASGAGVVALGLALLVSHGLAFAFGCAVGGALALVEARSLRRLVPACAPYAVLGLALIAFALASRGFSAPAGGGTFILDPNPATRIGTMLAYGQGFVAELLPLGVALVLVPYKMGLGVAWRAAVPFAVVVVVMLAVPHAAVDTFLLYQRFGMFALPFLALMFTVRPGAAVREGAQARAAAALMVAAVWLSLAAMAGRTLAFAREAADFEVVLAAAEPGKRALSLIIDADSAATRHHATYFQHASWYQADKRGLVDFNFGNYHPQVVRYRAEHAPAVNIGWDPLHFDWQRHRGRIYDYYLVRHGRQALPAQLIANPDCRIMTVAAAGAWTLLARGACS